MLATRVSEVKESCQLPTYIKNPFFSIICFLFFIIIFPFMIYVLRYLQPQPCYLVPSA